MKKLFLLSLFVSLSLLGQTTYQGPMIVGSGLSKTGDTLSASTGGLTTLADADKTLVVGTDNQYQIITAALTANRTITLSTSSAINGSSFTIIRKGLGLFTLNVGGLKTVPSATTSSVTVMYDGSAWQLIGYQLL